MRIKTGIRIQSHTKEVGGKVVIITIGLVEFRVDENVELVIFEVGVADEEMSVLSVIVIGLVDNWVSVVLELIDNFVRS